MADGQARKKFAILGVSSVLLVAMVVAVTLGTRSTDTDSYNHQQQMSDSEKAIQTICAPTDYKDTCINSLKSEDVKTTDPKELIAAAFNVTIKYINQAIKNSTVLQQLEKDPKTKLALDDCGELSQHAIEDLEKSYGKFQSFEVNNIDDILDDMKVWLSGAITYQETCLDGFENSTGESGEKMRQALNTSMELTSNGLAMINDISSVLTTLDIPSMFSRRLLAEDDNGAEFPTWIDSERRELLHATPRTIKADLIVAKDGSGKYRTINEALKDIPSNGKKLFVLYIKEGIYEEKVTFNRTFTHLMVLGDGPTKTKITGSLNFIDGTPTFQTATVAVLGDFFIAKDIGFENSAGAEKHQAVALRVGADKAIFYNCQMDGYQDTLYVHTYRQFYRNCVISGTIDFIFGDSASVFQNCTMVVRKPLDNQQCIVTAQGRKDVRQPTGLVLQNCSFVADPVYFPFRFQLKSYLGRPWKEYSRTVILESFIDDLIQPDGWLPWEGNFGLETLFYTEFNNRGPASNKNLRVKWAGVKELPAKRVERFLASKFIGGDRWIPQTGVPYSPGFIFPPPKENPETKYSPVVPEENKDLGKKKNKDSYVAKPDTAKSSPRSSLALPPTGFSPISSPAFSPIPAPTESSPSIIGWFMGKFW